MSSCIQMLGPNYQPYDPPDGNKRRERKSSHRLNLNERGHRLFLTRNPFPAISTSNSTPLPSGSLSSFRSVSLRVFLRVPLGILRKLVVDNGIDFRSPEPYEGGDKIAELIEGKSVAFFTEIGSQTRCKQQSNCGRKGFECQSQARNEREDELVSREPSKPDQDDNSKLDVDSKCQPDEVKHRLDDLVSNIGMASVQGASGPKYLGSTFEISFARIPVLQRGKFMEVFHRLYSIDQEIRFSQDLYLLNVVCAISVGLIFNTKSDVQGYEEERQNSHNRSFASCPQKRQNLFQDYQAEEYHASAVAYLEDFLGSWQSSSGFGGLEKLQVVLLFASFALIRPVTPDLLYIIGVAMRLAIDLEMHYEDGTGIDSIGEQDRLSRAWEEWVRDLRRRLLWCTYSFDCPTMTNAENAEDEDDIYLNVAEAGNEVILEKCLPAESCLDASERMSKATVQMCLSTTGFGSDAAMLGATRLKAAGEPVSPNIVVETVQIYEEHSSHPCPRALSSRENNIVSYNLPIAVLAATYHSPLYSRTITIPCNFESSSLRKSTMTMQIFDTATAGPTPIPPPASPAARIFLLKQNTTPAASPQNEHRPFNVPVLAQR
ncbi:hypothetical protein I7I51_04966 [Histoplasma capsulatum]|uniref:Xylanolytic transcriptional activator regulatory domain-containing protein n=1 Tax=Ajellomyces capsulatus TaxID=5037 RepID=A0A8A1M271_AJECA|nr:hypothetical protein I7I51_04966 [Histoplasma capsulatum]